MIMALEFSPFITLILKTLKTLLIYLMEMAFSRGTLYTEPVPSQLPAPYEQERVKARPLKYESYC